MGQVIDSAFLLQVALITSTYILFCKYQRVFFRGSYFSVQDIILSEDLRKAVPAGITRFLYVLLVSVVFGEFLGYAKETIEFSIILGSFLLTWPSLYLYRLANHRNNPLKRSYFWGCMLSIFFSYSAGMLSTRMLVPAIFGGRTISLISNDGLQIVAWLVGLIAPLSVSRLLRKGMDAHTFSYEFDTFYGDLRILENRMVIEGPAIDDYRTYIEKSSSDNGIPYELLRIVLLVEHMNRDTWMIRLVEYVICKYFPGVARRLDLSVGLAQLKISTVKELTGEPVKAYIMNLFDEQYSIEMCAQYIVALVKKYREVYCSWRTHEGDLFSSDDCEELCEYIVSEYLTGYMNSQQRYIRLYGAVLKGTICGNG